MSLGVIIFNPVSLLILLLFFFLNCNTVVAKYNKGLLPPPHRNSQFFLHPSEIFQRSKVPVNPSEMTFEAPHLPPHQKILSIVVGNGSGYLNGIDHNSFMVRGIVLIVLVSLKKTTARTTFLHKK